MKVVDGKILAATEAEMFSYWLSRGWDDVMSFPDYLAGCLRLGTVIVSDLDTEK